MNSILALQKLNSVLFQEAGEASTYSKCCNGSTTSEQNCCND
jgi:hypothetical protein